MLDLMSLTGIDISSSDARTWHSAADGGLTRITSLDAAWAQALQRLRWSNLQQFDR